MKLKIGNIEIDDVEQLKSGIYVYKNKHRKSRLDNVKPWDVILLGSKPLYKLVTIAEEIHRSGHKATDLSPPVLRDAIRKLLNCTEATANKYRTALYRLQQ